MSTLLAYTPIAGIWLAKRAFLDGSRGWTPRGFHYWACAAWQIACGVAAVAYAVWTTQEPEHWLP